MSHELEIKVPEGGIWEYPSFSILVNYVVRRNSSHYVCGHSIPQDDGSSVIPYVVEVLNEGGYRSTGLCLQCAVEAYKHIKGGDWDA